jgi:hypothetical protein
MPLLDYEAVKALRETPVRRCSCGYAAYRSYCRECDVYCELGHGHLCTEATDQEHENHRHY